MSSTSSKRPSKYIASCDKVKFQFWMGMVHFLVIFWMPTNNSFNRQFLLLRAALRVIGESALGFGQFTELAMDGFHGI